MGKMVTLESEAIAKDLLRRLPTPDELALLCGSPVEAVILAMAESARRRSSRLRKKGTATDVAKAIGVSLERLEAAKASNPALRHQLRWWVALHAWRPMSLRHAAKLAGIARGTAATIAAGRVRVEQPDEEEDRLRPKRVRRYYCTGCHKMVYLKPCVICEALSAHYPVPAEADDGPADVNP